MMREILWQKMKIISHRGNLNGSKPKLENSPEYILAALNSGFDVEVDVWLKSGNLFLGHDTPAYSTNLNFLKQKGLWCHAKNLDAFTFLLSKRIHTFWHEQDKVTLTSKKVIWCYPNNYISNGITVCLKYKQVPNFIKGICTDFPLSFKEKL
jgi:hypothetical protein